MNNMTIRAISGSIIVAIFIALFFLNSQGATFAVYLTITTVILGEISFNTKKQNGSKIIEYIAYTYVCTPILFIAYLFCVYGDNCDINNIFFMSLLTACVFDTSAYLGGKILKGPKIAPSISPAKTISGTLIGFLSVLVLYNFVLHRELLQTFSTAFVCSCGAFFGDLLQSKFKRVLGIKDMGILIPGHGGFGDRFDGLIGVILVNMLLYLLKSL